VENERDREISQKSRKIWSTDPFPSRPRALNGNGEITKRRVSIASFLSVILGQFDAIQVESTVTECIAEIGEERRTRELAATCPPAAGPSSFRD
jgi:hypothetical protein